MKLRECARVNNYVLSGYSETAVVVRTSSLNDKHSCQLFRKASSLVLLSSSVSLHIQPKLFASDHLLQS